MWRQDDDTQSMLRASAAGFLSSRHSLARFRACRRTDTGYDRSFWAEMGDLGWTGILLPETMDGAGLGLLPAATIAEFCGEHLVPEPFVASSVIAVTVLAASGSVSATDLARQIGRGAAVAVLADQEEAGVVSPQRPAASITVRNGRLFLSGKKVFVPHWSSEATLIVTSMYGGEPCVVALAPSSAGITFITQRMTDGSVTADVSLDGVALDEDAILLRGDAARDIIPLALARGTVALSAQLEGLSRKLHATTAEYVVQRSQFDRPLSDFQSIRHALANLYCEIDLSAASWRRAAIALEGGVSLGGIAAASAAKSRASDTALAVARAAIQYHGAFGYTEEADIGLYVNAALRWASWLGNASYHRRRALALHRQAAHV